MVVVTFEYLIYEEDINICNFWHNICLSNSAVFLS